MKAMAYAGITAALFFTTGCIRSNFTETDFQVSEGISLYVKGEQILAYTPEKYQIAFNPEAGEIRISDDDMADYFIVRFSGGIPDNEGEEMMADLEYTTHDDLKKQRSISFRVTRKDEARGLVWLWNEKGKTGMVLPDIKISE